MIVKTYSELARIHTFEERYEYLRLRSEVGTSTFGYDRYLNQVLYRSRRWKRIRDQVIVRDNGCDLGIRGYEITGLIIVHHMNPITIDDVVEEKECVFDLEGLICTTHNTHQAIHYGDKTLLSLMPPDRYPGDTTPWRKRN